MTTPEWQEIYSWGDQGYTYGKGAKEFWERAGYTNQELLDFFLSEMVDKYSGIKWIMPHMNFQGIVSLSQLLGKYLKEQK